MLRTVITVFIVALCVVSAHAAETDTTQDDERFPTASDAYTFDSPVLDMRWVKDEKGKPSIVLLQTRQGYVHKSVDGGRNWQPLSDLLKAPAVVQPAKSARVSSKDMLIQKMYMSPSDGAVGFFVSFGGTMHVTTDRFLTFSTKPTLGLKKYSMHPNEPHWLLATNHNNELLLTQDLGTTWKSIANRVYDFAWGRSAGEGWSKDSIIAAILEDDAPAPLESQLTKTLSLFVSLDFFSNREMLLAHGNNIIIKNNYMFSSTVNPEEESEATLRVSVNASPFLPCRFPYRISEHDYHILDASESNVFVEVDHGSDATVYTSGPHGTRFSLSLKHLRRGQQGVGDLTKIAGVDGVYIANVEDSHSIANVDEVEKVEASTRISFDKGGSWHPLKAPEFDHTGKRSHPPLPLIAPAAVDARFRLAACDSKDGCSLHLHGISSFQEGIPPLYSGASAVGVIIAIGNVGHHLHYRADEANVMMSRDSGLTWTQVAKGTHIYEVADHGGLIVLANDRIATNKVLYTWNEGGNWTGFQFWKHHMEVENVITEPRGAGQEFIVYGRRKGKGVVVHVDFSSVHKRRCEGAESPGASDSDFETYTPAAALLGKQCLLGKRITYTRRKATSACYNGDEFERSSSVEICECQSSDFECDFGFEKKGMSGKDGASTDSATDDWCVRQPGLPPLSFGPPKECSVSYEQTRGYRLVSGNDCKNGVSFALAPLVLPCRSFTTAGFITTFIIVVIAVASALFCAFKFQTGRNPDSIQDVIDMVYPMKSSTSRSSYGRMDSGADDGECLGYAETMDDEPDVMNDVALRSVVSSSAHSALQQPRSSITPATGGKVPTLAPPTASKFAPGSKSLQLDSTDFDD